MLYAEFRVAFWLVIVVVLFWIVIALRVKEMRKASLFFLAAILSYILLRDLNPVAAMILTAGFTLAGIVLLPNQIYSPPPRSS